MILHISNLITCLLHYLYTHNYMVDNMTYYSILQATLHGLICHFTEFVLVRTLHDRLHDILRYVLREFTCSYMEFVLVRTRCMRVTGAAQT